MNRTIYDVSSEIGSGITPLRSNGEYWNSRDIPWVKTEQLGEYQIFDSNEYISKTALAETSIKLWPPKTVSVAMYGEGKTRGNVSILMMHSTTNQACCNIVVDPQKADYRFLYYWLKNNYEQLRMLAAGVRKNLNSDDVKGFPFPDFGVTYQAKIADILSAIDDLIQRNRNICSELETMAKTIYDYWFTQFDFPDADGKPYRSSGGAMEWNEQLKRKIPEGWDVGSLGSMGTITSGGTPSTKSSAYYSSKGIAWITPNDLSGKEHKLFFSHGERDITREGLNNSSAVLMPKGTVLFSSRAPIGYIAIAENEICSNQGFKSIVPDKGYSSFFVYYTVKVHTPAIAKQGVGTTFKEVSRDTMERFRIVLPPPSIANEFERILSAAFEKRRILEHENDELTKLRDWLLPMLMNGQATVADAEEEVAKVIPFAPQTVEVRQAARNFGDKKTDDTADLVKAFMRRKKNDSKA